MSSFFKYTYSSKIEINAGKATVWNALTNIKSYPDWNPFTIRVDTTWKIGSEVYLTVKMKPHKKPMIRTEYLSVFEPNDEMAWGMDLGILLKASRSQRLTAVSEGVTKYENSDTITGMLSPVVHMLYGKWITKGFEGIAKGLKKHVESHE